MQQRIVPFITMEGAMTYAEYVCSLAGAVVLFALPNAIVVQYNSQVLLVIARDEEGG